MKHIMPVVTQGFAPRLARAAVAALLALAATLGLSRVAGAQELFAKGPVASFTAAQAQRGQAAYANTCQMCHGARLEGQLGPALTGAAFQGQWRGEPTAALLWYMTTTMPPSAPGSLSQQTMADIAAYVLQTNGIGAGARELLAAQLMPTGADAAALAARIAEPGFNRGPENLDATYQAVSAQHAHQLQSLTPVSDAMLLHPADGDWLMWRRGYASLGFSPLTQISAHNVATLRTAWTWTLPVSPDEITPLVHDGVIFIKSANEVQALDGASGDLLWKYTRPLPDALHGGRTEIVKNLAIYQDRLFAPTADGHIVALDARSGKVVWDQAVLSSEALAQHLRMDGGPIVVHGKVIQGVSGCNTYPGGCFIVALDAASGRPLWQFNTLARTGEPGGDSWNGAPVEQRYGGSVWTSGSYDPQLNLLYFGIGQTYDTATLLQPHGNGQNGASATGVGGSGSDAYGEVAPPGAANSGLYTDSTVALNPDTGKLVWYYQHFNRDVWDFDWVFEQSLLTLPVNGRPTPLLVTAGKIAIFDAINRADGRYAFSQDLGLQNLVSSIDPRSGRKILNPALTPEANKTKLVCPHPGGARSWPSTSYDPATHLLYVPLVESCMQFTWTPRSASETAQGGSDIHWVLLPRPDSDGKIGRLEAIDLQSRKVAWIRRQRAPESASVLATAGGVVFDGTRDRNFQASDSRSGRILWQMRLNAVPSSAPVSYSIGGTQYIAVIAGGGGADDVTWPRMTPEIENPTGGTTLWVFRLPGAVHP